MRSSRERFAVASLGGGGGEGLILLSTMLVGLTYLTVFFACSRYTTVPTGSSSEPWVGSSGSSMGLGLRC